VYAAWLAGDLERRLPGGETGAELRHRMHHVLHEIAERHPGETVLAVSHGGLMRLTLPLILTGKPADPPARLANCDTIELSVDGGHWRCLRWPAADAPVGRPVSVKSLKAR
jgi:broad specificity phosphatase PhoE